MDIEPLTEDEKRFSKTGSDSELLKATSAEARAVSGIEEEVKEPAKDSKAKGFAQDDDDNDWVDVQSGASSDHKIIKTAREDADKNFNIIFDRFEQGRD